MGFAAAIQDASGTEAPGQVLQLWVRKGAKIFRASIWTPGMSSSPVPATPLLLRSAIALATGAGPHPSPLLGSSSANRGLLQGCSGEDQPRPGGSSECRWVAESCRQLVGTSWAGGYVCGAGRGPARVPQLPNAGAVGCRRRTGARPGWGNRGAARG